MISKHSQLEYFEFLQENQKYELPLNPVLAAQLVVSKSVKVNN